MSKLRIGWIGVAGAGMLALSLIAGRGCATNDARRDDLVTGPLNVTDAKVVRVAASFHGQLQRMPSWRCSRALDLR